MNNKFAGIKVLVMDVDGVLTDGGMIYGVGDEQVKVFNAQDGLGIRLAREAGLEVVIVTGNSATAIEHRANDLGLPEIFQGAKYKAKAIQEICRRSGVSPEQIGFIGDDLNDLPAFDAGCVCFAVANAVEEVKTRADYVTSKHGGHGAVREVIELILKAQGRWEEAVRAFLEILKREETDGSSRPVA